MLTLESIVDRLRKAEEIQAQYENLIGSDFQSALEESQVHAIKDIENHLSELRRENRMLQIGIIGRVKAGKSSLLNALFFEGKDVLPHAATPMTAALTTLGYGARPAMRVEFFSSVDLQAFQRLHGEYEKAIMDGVEERKQQRQQAVQRNSSTSGHRPNSLGTKPATVRSLPEKTDDELQDIVKRELDRTTPSSAAAYELWESVRKAGGIERCPKDQRIEKNSIEELSLSLGEYVGAGGRHTPYTKCLHLELPFDALKDVKVVDTPGLNDPIQSREKRTQDMLKECDAVFVISPAGQFLSSQDVDLLQRLAGSDGVKEIFVIASQFDTQLFGAELQDCAGQIEDAIGRQKRSLVKQAQQVFSSEAVQRLQIDNLLTQLDQRMITSSSVAYAMQTLPSTQWNETVSHMNKRLHDRYPESFSSPEKRAQSLDALSGLPAVAMSMTNVRANKETIFARREGDYLEGQLKAGRDFVMLLKAAALKRQHIFANVDAGIGDARLKEIETVRKKGSKKVNSVFVEVIDSMEVELAGKLRRMVADQFEAAVQKSELAKGSSTETRDKDGFIAGAARLFGMGGRESYQVDTIDPTSVRLGINAFRKLLELNLTQTINEEGIYWRNKASGALLGTLRETIDAEYIDVENIKASTRLVLRELMDLPEPELPAMPEALFATERTLKSSRAREFDEAAKAYLAELRKIGDNYAKRVKKKLSAMTESSIGEAIFDELKQDADQLKAQLKERDVTKKRYTQLLTELEALSA